jgi:hypothetical protein
LPEKRARAVRKSGAKRTVIDGPFAEAKELIALAVGRGRSCAGGLKML